MNEIENALSHIENFQFIHEHLFTSAQPTAEQLKLIKEYAVTTIVNLGLSDAEQHLAHEDKICLDLGLNYIQFSISTEIRYDDKCLLILDMLAHLVQEQLVLVKKKKNYHVSCLMYLYRQYYMNMDMPTAQELMHSIWEPNETWTGLIHAVALQLQGRKATKELQQSLIHPDHFA